MTKNVAVLLGCALTSSVSAQLDIVADVRTLSASAHAEVTSIDTDNPVPLTHVGVGGAFDESLRASALLAGASASAIASQRSVVEVDSIEATGSANASASAAIGASGSDASSSLDLVFRPRAEVTVLLVASTSSSGAGQSSLVLTDTTNHVDLQVGSGVLRTRLAQAEYRLLLNAVAGASAPGGSGGAAGYAVVFKLCLADLNADLTVNTNDFFEFLALYQRGDTRADFSGDARIDTNDFFGFLAAYQRGC